MSDNQTTQVTIIDLDVERFKQINERLSNSPHPKEKAKYYDYYKEDLTWLIDRVLSEAGYKSKWSKG